MERLTSIQTIEYADGTSHEQIYCFGHLWGPAFFKKGTKDYEEYLSIVKRLAKYEDLEEQGKMLKLPCKAGQKVYLLRKDIKTVIDGEITSFDIGEFAKDMRIFITDDNRYTNISFDKVGDIVFFTREEAEAALKELEKG